MTAHSYLYLGDCTLNSKLNWKEQLMQIGYDKQINSRMKMNNNRENHGKQKQDIQQAMIT